MRIDRKLLLSLGVWAVLSAILFGGCGDGSDQGSNATSGVTGSVVLPSPKPQNESGQWTTDEIARLLRDQEGVQAVRCSSISAGRFAARWRCTVTAQGQKGVLVVRADRDERLSSAGDAIPGFSLG